MVTQKRLGKAYSCRAFDQESGMRRHTGTRQLKWSVENMLAGMVGSSAIVVPIRDQPSNDMESPGEKCD